MKIRCTNCNAAYAVDDEKVAGKKFGFECPKCGVSVVIDNRPKAATPEKEEAGTEKTVENNIAENDVTEEDAEAAEQAKKYQHFKSNDEVIARLKEISEGDCQVSKQEIDALKQAFYKIHMNNVEEAKKKFIEDGGAEADFIPQMDEREGEFKDIMSVIKEKRNKKASSRIS